MRGERTGIMAQAQQQTTSCKSPIKIAGYNLLSWQHHTHSAVPNTHVGIQREQVAVGGVDASVLHDDGAWTIRIMELPGSCNDLEAQPWRQQSGALV